MRSTHESKISDRRHWLKYLETDCDYIIYITIFCYTKRGYGLYTYERTRESR